MSRFAVAFLLALVLPQATATGFMGKQPEKEVDPAAATAEVVTEEPVIKVEAAPEQPEDQVYNRRRRRGCAGHRRRGGGGCRG